MVTEGPGRTIRSPRHHLINWCRDRFLLFQHSHFRRPTPRLPPSSGPLSTSTCRSSPASRPHRLKHPRCPPRARPPSPIHLRLHRQRLPQRVRQRVRPRPRLQLQLEATGPTIMYKGETWLPRATAVEMMFVPAVPLSCPCIYPVLAQSQSESRVRRVCSHVATVVHSRQGRLARTTGTTARTHGRKGETTRRGSNRTRTF
jgi:hypothetical protein